MAAIDRRTLGLVAALIIAQALAFHDHFAVALTVLFGIGLGLWLRHWTAALWALAIFVLAFALATFTGWMDGARPVADALLGGALAFLGGLIGGGIFQVLREERPAVRARERAPARRADTQEAVRPQAVPRA